MLICLFYQLGGTHIPFDHFSSFATSFRGYLRFYMYVSVVLLFTFSLLLYLHLNMYVVALDSIHDSIQLSFSWS